MTESGKRLKQYADEILRIVDELIIAVPDNSEPSGTIIIGSVESFCTYRLSSILGRYRPLYPKVELIFRTGICTDLHKAVLNGSFDAALTFKPTVTSEKLFCEPLLQECMLVLAHPIILSFRNKYPNITGMTVHYYLNGWPEFPEYANHEKKLERDIKTTLRQVDRTKNA